MKIFLDDTNLVFTKMNQIFFFFLEIFAQVIVIRILNTKYERVVNDLS